MNAVTPLPNTQSVLELPHDLASKVEALSPRVFPGIDGDDPGFRLPPRVEHDPRAVDYLQRFEHACRSPDLAVIRAWFTKLSRAIRNPPSEEDFPKRVSAIAEACIDLPAAVWTSETLNEARRTLEWWPSAKTIYDLLEPKAKKLRQTRDALRRMSEPPATPLPSSAAREEPTDDAKSAVHDLVRSFVAERSWNQPQTPSAAQKVRAVPMSDRALLAAYEKLALDLTATGHLGAEAAKTRAALLRAKIHDAERWHGDPEPEEAA